MNDDLHGAAVSVPSTEIEVVAHPSIADVRLEHETPAPLGTGVIVLVVGVIGALLAFGWYAGTRATNENTQAVIEAAAGSPAQALDEFEGDGPIGETGLAWSILGPPFQRAAGAATVPAEPFGATAMLLHDTGWSDGTVGMTIRTPSAGTGLVFRGQDVFNHWALIAAPDFGTWNLVLTVNGEDLEVRPLRLTAVEFGTRVAVVLDGPSIRVLVDGAPQLDLLDPTLESGTAVGVIGVAGTGGAIDDVFAVAADPVDAAAE